MLDVMQVSKMLLVGPACDSMRLQSGGWTKHWQVGKDTKHTMVEHDSSREYSHISRGPGGRVGWFAYKIRFHRQVLIFQWWKSREVIALRGWWIGLPTRHN